MLGATATLLPSYQPPSPSPARSVSLSVFLRFACSFLAVVPLMASASSPIRVLCKVSLSILRTVVALSSPPRASASFVGSPWSTLTVCGPDLPPNSKLIGFAVSGPTSFLFRSFLICAFSPWLCVAVCCCVLLCGVWCVVCVVVVVVAALGVDDVDC